MKRIIIPLICLLYILSLSTCSGPHDINRMMSEETEFTEKAINALFYAIDNKDSETIYEVFSPYARKNDKNLKENINKLLSIYSGPTDATGWDGVGSSSEGVYYGQESAYSEYTFPIRSGDTYYWCYMKLMYKNDFDKNKIGLVELDFYTADEYCICRNSDDEESDEEESSVVESDTDDDAGAEAYASYGLYIYAEKTIPEDVICVNGYPYKVTSETKPLDIKEVKDFFKKSNSFAEFKKQFGEPNAELDYDRIYKLPAKNGKARYLELGVDAFDVKNKDRIFGADIDDDFTSIDKIYTVYNENEK